MGAIQKKNTKTFHTDIVISFTLNGNVTCIERVR